MSRSSHDGRAGRSLTRPFLVLVVCSCALFLGLTVWIALRHARDHARSARLSDHLLQTIELNDRLRALLDDHSRLLFRALTDYEDSLPDALEALHFEAGHLQNRYLELAVETDERLAVENIRALQGELALRTQYVLELLRGGRRAEALRLADEAFSIQADLDIEFRTLFRIRSEGLQHALTEKPSAAPFGPIVAIGFAAMLVFCLVFILLLRRRVLMPLASFLRVAARIESRDYSSRVRIGHDDELGRLSRQFNRMTDALAQDHARLEAAVQERTRELRETQERLVQAEKMSAVGRLVSGVAHELNNPLTAIIGFTELARTRVGTDQRAAALGALDTVLEQSERCRRIVADLLQFARQRETQLVDMDLNDPVRSAAELHGHTARTADVTVHARIAESCPVRGDPFKLQQVVLVLLNNATDAIRGVRESGNIWVRTAVEDELAILEVEDDGGGIRDPDRVFEPFYTTKQGDEGTGLGLSISYGIIQQHGGLVTARNLSLGACFRVSLPLRRSVADRPRPPRVEPTSHAARPTGRVLVVDDEEQIVELQQAFLEDLGLETLSAFSGDEAIRVLEKEEVDLVLSDIRMPGAVNGLRLFDWVQRHRPSLVERFYFVSGDLVSIEREFERELPRPCIRKPFNLEDYARIVREAFGGVANPIS